MTFKKLENLPKVPHTYDDVMKAMAELYKGVLKQSHMYGGKSSKLFIPQVVETSLMKSINADDLYENDEICCLLDLADRSCEDLASRLKDQNDERSLQLLTSLLRGMHLAINADRSKN